MTNIKTLSFSAPAKVILVGEHAVVYGKPALVAAVDLRLKFSLYSETKIEEKREDKKIIVFISKEVKKYLQKQKIPFEDRYYYFKIESQIPIKQRLGSSAALAVATSATFLKWYTGRNFDNESINNVAYQIEKYFHKNSSGVDTSVSTYGGLIFYRKEFEFLKHISVLNFKIPNKIADDLYLVDSGEASESTGEMVTSVANLYNKKPQLIEQILNDIEKVVKRMTVAIVKEDRLMFEQCIVDNQIYLEMLEVSSKRASELLKSLAKLGVGKVTGGGGRKNGSGYMFFLTNNRAKFEEFCKSKKISYFKFRPANFGMREEL